MHKQYLLSFAKRYGSWILTALRRIRNQNLLLFRCTQHTFIGTSQHTLSDSAWKPAYPTLPNWSDWRSKSSSNLGLGNPTLHRRVKVNVYVASLVMKKNASLLHVVQWVHVVNFRSCNTLMNMSLVLYSVVVQQWSSALIVPRRVACVCEIPIMYSVISQGFITWAQRHLAYRVFEVIERHAAHMFRREQNKKRWLYVPFLMSLVCGATPVWGILLTPNLDECIVLISFFAFIVGLAPCVSFLLSFLCTEIPFCGM